MDDAGVIQHFEFTDELSWKFEQRLIGDVEPWMRYHAARNLMAHAYVPEIAAQVYAAVPGFLANARRLLAALEARND